MKDDGYLFITDFSYVYQPKELFDEFGMYTSSKYGGAPPDWKVFNFYIDKAPNDPFEIFQIGPNLMMKAGIDAGFKECDFKLQYPDPEVSQNATMRKYLNEHNPSDYLMKLKN